MNIEVISILVFSLYLILHLFLLYGLHRSLSLKKRELKEYPKISLIVAARNESENIAGCIKALAQIDYPKDKLEIILVNDNSTDNTRDIMMRESYGYQSFKVIDSRPSVSINLKGKANAIDTAIEHCSGEIIVSTDADCLVPENWAKSIVRYYSGNTGMVCGFTEIESKGSIFAKLQNIDWMYLLTLASASAGLKMIMSCVGNNLSFSKRAYFGAGGYSSIGFSVTEDLALMRKVNSHKKYDILFPVDKDCLVRTLPCKNLSELFSQKRRWFRGGIGINFLGYILGAELYLTNIILLFGLFFLSFKLYLILISIKCFAELMLLGKTFQRLSMNHLYKYYLPFILYFAFYGLTLPLSFLFDRKINWKGRKF